MAHFLPGGGVPRLNGARSPVPPRLPHFATPRSVRHLATVVAGTYPLRRPPDAWSPGLLAPPGPCYWLVASGTAMGWGGGCLAAALVRSTVCYYCLGGCSALVVCVRPSRQALGVGAGAGSRFSPWAPPFPRFPRGACCGWFFPGVPSLCLPVPIPCGLRVPRARSGCPSGPGRVSVACVCARGLAAYAPLPPPWVGVARALRAFLVQGARQAVPGVLCPSAFPAPVPCSADSALGAVARSLRPLAWLGVAPPCEQACSCELGLRPFGGGTRAPGGLRLLRGCGASGGGRSPTDAFLSGGLATGRCGRHAQASRQQSTALTGASSCSCHVTKRFRILATLRQGNRSMNSNTSEYVHMGLRLD